MKTPFLISVLLLIFNAVNAQQFIIGDLSTLSDHLSYKNIPGQTYYDNIDGSPYLNDEFIPGDVIIADSTRFEHVQLRYNILTDKMEFINNQKQVLEIDNSKNNYRFIFNNQNFVSRQYLDEGQKQNGILEQLTEGRLKLYKKYSAQFKPEEKAIGFQDAQPNRIEKLEDKYLLGEEDGMPETIIINKKTLFAKLRTYKPAVENFAKKEKIRLSSEEDLTRLINYCNE